MARVFLSHASADKVVVRRIAGALRDAGHDPWLDEEAILVGESIPAAVGRGLGDADFVLLCLSKAAAERGWVEAERDASVMQQFSERKERVLPLRLEDVQPPHLIAQLAYADLFPDDQAFAKGMDRVVRSIDAYHARHAALRPCDPPLISAAGECHVDEISRILAETDVSWKYGQDHKAIHQLFRVLTLDPDNDEAHERLKHMFVSQARDQDDETAMRRLAELAAPTDHAEQYLLDPLLPR